VTHVRNEVLNPCGVASTVLVHAVLMMSSWSSGLAQPGAAWLGTALAHEPDIVRIQP